jgi:hypothetical protein
MTLDAGVTVGVDWHGSQEPLPADIDASAFRIIQEAVTGPAPDGSLRPGRKCESRAGSICWVK